MLLMGAGVSHAQTGTITGTVTDTESQDTLPGANVVILGTQQGSSTNADGQYRITGIQPGTYTVRASFVGYQQKAVEDVTVEAGATTELNFRLTRGVTGEEVVVVAYGEQQRRDVTGSISSIESQEIEGTASTSLEQALQGQVAGVDVTQGDAAPGGGISVQIRGVTTTLGSNEPLYVVDGVPINTSGVSTDQLSTQTSTASVMTDTDPLATLSPSDIKSIEVLKDASATAMYGSRAANGVVIITTKEGSDSGAGQISVDYKRSFSTPVKFIDMLGAGDYARYTNEANVNAGNDIVYGYDDPMQGDPRTPESIADTAESINWQDRVFRVASTDDLGLGFSGGDEEGSYNVRGNLLRQEGVISGSEFLRGGLRANLDRQVTDAVEIQSQLNVTRSANSLVRSSSNNNGAIGGIVRGAQKYPPLRPFVQNRDELEDERAIFEQNRFPDRFGSNPLRYTDEVKLDQGITRGIGNLKALVDLTESLTLDLSVGANYQQKGYHTYYPSTVAEGEPYNGLAALSSNTFLQLVTENLVRFNQSFGNHDINAVAGVSYEDNESEWARNEAQDFPDDQIGRGTLTAGKVHLATDSGIQEWRLLSGLSRVNYTFMDRYNLTATFRADGSSKFASNNKWAYFPSLGAAWQVIQEPFLQDVDWLSNLKLRASWGQSGNQAIGAYSSKAQLDLGSTTFNNQVVSSAYPALYGGLPNPNLQWETTSQTNLGLDLAFFNSRLRVTADAYQKKTTDLLQQIQLAPNTGFPQTLINAGSVRNRGLELQVGGDVLTGDVSWTVTANASRNVNEITSLPVEEQFASRLGSGRINFQPFIQTEGQPIGVIYGYETDGLYRSQQEIENHASAPSNAQVGDIRYVDQQSEGEEGYGTLNDEDRTFIGNANPDFVWGLTNSFQFGDLSLRVLIDSKIGGDIINAQRIRTLRLDAEGNIPEDIYENAFRPENYDNPYGSANPDGKYPYPRADRGTFSRFSDMFVEDGSYVRLKNVQIGYRFEVPYAQQARLYVNGTNLWTLTGYSGYSPEVSAFGDAARRGVDLGSYPQNRTFGVGVDLTF
jgi:TonB-linked SusC/RagA family outer membrane protein